MKYAQETSVSVEKSKIEIEKILLKYGATSFVYGLKDGYAVIQFEANNRRVKFVLPLPSEMEYQRTPKGQYRHHEWLVRKAWEQGCRARWRALLLIIKAKLEAVESKVSTFEYEFAMMTVLPNSGGKTVGEVLGSQIDESYRTGELPPLLGMGS